MKTIKFIVSEVHMDYARQMAKQYEGNKGDNRSADLRVVHAQAGIPEVIMIEAGEWEYVIDLKVDAFHPMYGPIEVKMLNKSGEFNIPSEGKRWFLEQQRGHVNGFLFLQYETPMDGARIWNVGDEIIVNIIEYKTYDEVMGPEVIEEDDFEGDLTTLTVRKTRGSTGLRKASALSKYTQVVAEAVSETNFWILDDCHGATGARHLVDAAGTVIKQLK